MYNTRSEYEVKAPVYILFPPAHGRRAVWPRYRCIYSRAKQVLHVVLVLDGLRLLRVLFRLLRHVLLAEQRHLGCGSVLRV